MSRIISSRLNVITQFLLACGFGITNIGFGVVYAENKNDIFSYAEFNTSSLMGLAKDIDLKEYSHGNPVLPGTYNIDVNVNGNYVGNREYIFQKINTEGPAEKCFTYNELSSIGVDIKKIEILSDKSICRPIHDWIPQAYARMNMNEMRLNISIPQVYTQKNVRGFVPFEVWDRGINAAYISYYLNNQSGKNNDTTYKNTFLSLNTGLNLLGWQLRYNGNANWIENKSEYTSINAYAQRAFPQIRSVLTLGQSYTSGEAFNSFAYTGLQLRSDDRMLPESITGYAPIIRGTAQTNATVEIRQNGQLINQYNVAPGNFIIDDLYPTGYAGNLDVIVREANGQVQQFSVPYAAVAEMLRPGHQRYALTFGKVRDKSLLDQENFGLLTYRRGINNLLTGYTGSLIAENYQSYLLGVALGTRVGAFSFDMTHSDADLLSSNKGNQTGQSYKASYSKYLLPTNTNFSLVAYRYSTEGFLSFQNALQLQDMIKRGLSNNNFSGQEKSQYQLSVSQNIGQKGGTFYLAGTWSDYWENDTKRKDYHIGYNNSYKSLTYGISAQRIRNNLGQSDDQYYLRFSFPLDIGKRSVNYSQVVSNESNSSSFFGTLNDARTLNYSLGMTNIGYADAAVNGNLRYRNSITAANVFAGTGSNYHQYGANLSGAVVAHSGGITFTPENISTPVIVQAKNATGAQVNNTLGLKLDSRGYAVIPNATPYRINQITLDPKGMNSNVELQATTQDLVPYEGAITKVEFKSKSGFPILIKSKQASGEPLPFGSTVYDANNNVVGVVSQGSRLFIRTTQLHNNVIVKWGGGQAQQCRVSYRVDNNTIKTNGYIFIEEMCE